MDMFSLYMYMLKNQSMICLRNMNQISAVATPIYHHNSLSISLCVSA